MRAFQVLQRRVPTINWTDGDKTSQALANLATAYWELTFHCQGAAAPSFAEVAANVKKIVLKVVEDEDQVWDFYSLYDYNRRVWNRAPKEVVSGNSREITLRVPHNLEYGLNPTATLLDLRQRDGVKPNAYFTFELGTHANITQGDSRINISQYYYPLGNTPRVAPYYRRIIKTLALQPVTAGGVFDVELDHGIGQNRSPLIGIQIRRTNSEGTNWQTLGGLEYLRLKGIDTGKETTLFDFRPDDFARLADRPFTGAPLATDNDAGDVVFVDFAAGDGIGINSRSIANSFVDTLTFSSLALEGKFAAGQAAGAMQFVFDRINYLQPNLIGPGS